MTKKDCSIEGCDRGSDARGWCNKHYQRWIHYGDPEHPGLEKKVCSVEGCPRKHYARGLCPTHAARMRKHGDVETIGASGRPLKGEFPSWGAVHKRLTRARGRAAEQRCVDCLGPAQEWSYNGKDPEEIRGYVGKFELRWSLNLDTYEPRCSSCHRLFDNAMRKADIQRAPDWEPTAYMELKVVSR